MPASEARPQAPTAGGRGGRPAGAPATHARAAPGPAGSCAARWARRGGPARRRAPPGCRPALCALQPASLAPPAPGSPSAGGLPRPRCSARPGCCWWGCAHGPAPAPLACTCCQAAPQIPRGGAQHPHAGCPAGRAWRRLLQRLLLLMLLLLGARRLRLHPPRCWAGQHQASARVAGAKLRCLTPMTPQQPARPGRSRRSRHRIGPVPSLQALPPAGWPSHSDRLQRCWPAGCPRLPACCPAGAVQLRPAWAQRPHQHSTARPRRGGGRTGCLPAAAAVAGLTVGSASGPGRSDPADTRGLRLPLEVSSMKVPFLSSLAGHSRRLTCALQPLLGGQQRCTRDCGRCGPSTVLQIWQASRGWAAHLRSSADRAWRLRLPKDAGLASPAGAPAADSASALKGSLSCACACCWPGGAPVLPHLAC